MMGSEKNSLFSDNIQEGEKRIATVDVSLAHHHYQVHIGDGLLERAASALVARLRTLHAVIITDETVQALHLARLEKALKHAQPDLQLDIFAIPPGERSKSFSCYITVMDALLLKGIERSTSIIAFGGGVVGDFAGFIAATALRGLPFIQIPTTLLAQVDSSVGGKTGINARAGKNLVGAFWQPELVLADSTVLQTLPRRQLVAGYAEIVKAGLIADPELFAWCEKNGSAVLNGEPESLKEAVQKACAFKARIVGEDEREQARSGGRALLNLGHTFAHALEAEYHYDGRLLHGEAVSIGLSLAYRLSVSLGFAKEDGLNRLETHLAALNMPARLADLPTTLSAETLLSHMQKDKKRQNGKINFVLLRDIGDAFTTTHVPFDPVRALFLAEGCIS